MTFAAPGWIALGALASLAVVAIHLIAWRLPRTVTLPTARFVPDERARRASRTVRLSDVSLLLLRVALIMVGGLAMARPRFATAPTGEATVVAVERSRAVADIAALRDSLRAAGSGADRVSYVVFDTAVRTLSAVDAAYSALSDSGLPAEASLTVGLVAAIREARRLERDYETVRIIVASTFTEGAFDHATRDVRESWHDSLQLIRVPANLAVPRSGSVATAETVDDPIIAGIRLAESSGLLRGTSRVIRDSVDRGGPADSGSTIVFWPRVRAASAARIDGVHAGGYSAIGHFVRGSSIDSGRVIARWANGGPAAWEVRRDGGCVRHIGFDVPDVGDFTLTPSFQRLVAVLLRPCADGATSVAPDSAISALAAFDGDRNVPALPDESAGMNRLAALLMMVAVALALLELWVRSRRAPASVELA